MNNTTQNITVTFNCAEMDATVNVYYEPGESRITDKDEAAILAVNSHDALTERVKVLEAALKEIGDTTNEGTSDFRSDDDRYGFCIYVLDLADEALKAVNY